ncbi:MAG TPA: oligogalacturonate lyase family protein [Armatimonadota bacterium]|jgi:oligogalacturonide lyase
MTLLPMEDLPTGEKSTFTDPVTGRTIHRLTGGGINVSPYFNNFGWTPEGDWIYFLRLADAAVWVMACEVATGRLRRLAGPFPADATSWDPMWTTLNAIPGARAVTFVQGGALWRVELDGPMAEKVADLPGEGGYGDSDVSGDGRWHMLGCILMSEAARAEEAQVGWPPDEFYARHQISTLLFRVDLLNGEVQTLWEEPAVVDHISINPRDPEQILYCHEGAIPYQYGRMFLRRIGEETSRPLRDQRSGRVWVTHERWFADGEHIAYHGYYRPDGPESPRQQYVGILDVPRDLPHEYTFADPAQAAWHSTPNPQGTRLAMDQMSGQGGLSLLDPDPASGICRIEPLTGITSDLEPLPRGQWRETDPVWSPDGRRLLFRVARQGEVDVYLAEVE